jgi:signal transduction histidine kinase
MPSNHGDARAFISRSISYACSLFVLALFFFGTEFVVEKFIYNNDEVVDIICAMAGAFSFHFFRSVFDRITDNIFFRKEYDYAKAIHKIGPLLNTTIDLKLLLQIIYGFLSQTIKPERVVFIFEEASNPIFFPSPNNKEQNIFPDKVYLDLADHFFMDFKQSVFVQELKSDGEHAETVSMAYAVGITAIVPLALKEEARAVMLLGPRLSGAGLRNKDIALITALCQQAGMAIRNARLYEAVRQYNEVLEANVAERTEKMRLMYESQSKFLTEVSHELQTPIAIIRGNVELLQQRGKQEHGNPLRVIATTMNDMSRLVDNLLESARLKFSKNIFYKKELCVGTLLQEIYEDCFILVEDKGIRMSVESEDIRICADRNKLKEVILNLISNALKHTPSQGSVFLMAKAKDGIVSIIVEDTGSGISPLDLPHIFDRFYKIESVGGPRAASTGIGLDICRQIIEAHAGKITAESQLGKGSRFIIQLPILL